MRKPLAGVLAVSLAAAAAVLVPGYVAATVGGALPAAVVAAPAGADQLRLPPNPLQAKRQAAREQAVQDVVSGRSAPERRGTSTVARVGGAGRAGGSQFAEVEHRGTDRVFVILAEFGTERHPDFPDGDTQPNVPGPDNFDGPLHNQIPAPDRSVDNTTVWQPDSSTAFYRNLYFGATPGSLKSYLRTQSSGRYSIGGVVTDWVKVRYNQARYGRSNHCGPGGGQFFAWCDNAYELPRDAANQWVADQLARGRSKAEVVAELRSFDQWDRYDFDGDGNFSEPDGYLDRLQVVHAGRGRQERDPQYGEDAIYPHRDYADITEIGAGGPDGNPNGGTEIADTGIWIGDYMVMAENIRLGRMTREFLLDHGLPSDDDTPTAGDTSTAWWSPLGRSFLVGDDGLGAQLGDLGAWAKLQLGWLDYRTVRAGQHKTLQLGPEEVGTHRPQAVVVNLPPKVVTVQYGAPAEGARQHWSGRADFLENTLARDLDLTGKTTASLSMKGRYEIEEGFDFLFVEASTDGGQTWATLDGTVNGRPFVRDDEGRPGITGDSAGEWTDVAVPLDSVAGQPVRLRLRYHTDLFFVLAGFFADSITIVADGAPVFTDGAEADAGWVAEGWSTVGATGPTTVHDHFYLAGYRSTAGYGRNLRTGPHDLGYANTRPKFADTFPYQQGLLVTYWDTSWTDNDLSLHPGEGRDLNVDAHPQPLLKSNGTRWRVRVQVYDAPFGLTPTDPLTLHVNGEPETIVSQPGQPLFDDTQDYFDPGQALHGVKLPAIGVKIRVLSTSGSTMKVKIS